MDSNISRGSITSSPQHYDVVQYTEQATPSPSYSEAAHYPSYSEAAHYPSYSGEVPYPSYSEAAPYPSYSGEAPYPSYSGEAPYPSYSGEAPYPSYSGEAPYPSYSGEAPSPSYSEAAHYPSYSEAAHYPSYSGEAPSPSYSGEAPYPSYSGEAPYPSYSGEVPYPSYSGEAPHPSYSGEAPYPSYSEAAMEPPIARRSRLKPHEVKQAAYQLARSVNGMPIEDASDRQRLADATATMHETRLALDRGRGNIDRDLQISKGRCYFYTALSHHLGRYNNDLMAGIALAARAGNCDQNAVINVRQHALRMENGGQMMYISDDGPKHAYALYQPPNSAKAVVLDSWANGPAVLLSDARWAKTYRISTRVIEHFDKPQTTDALARTNAFKAEMEDPQTELYREARKLEENFRAPPIYDNTGRALSVIAPELAESTRLMLAEYSAQERHALAAQAARDSYGLADELANSPRTTEAILKEASKLDKLGRPHLSYARGELWPRPHPDDDPGSELY